MRQLICRVHMLISILEAESWRARACRAHFEAQGITSVDIPFHRRGREQARLAAQLAALAGERWDLAAGLGAGGGGGAMHTAAACADELATLCGQRLEVGQHWNDACDPKFAGQWLTPAFIMSVPRRRRLVGGARCGRRRCARKACG